MSINIPETVAISLLSPDHVKLGETITLEEVFNAFVNYLTLDIHVSDILCILTAELNIKTDSLTQLVENVLIDAVFYYCKSWEGWGRRQEFLSGMLTQSEWFDSFQQYLLYKCNDIIAKADDYIRECKVKVTNRSTQTEPKINYTQTNIRECPYKLVISGPPSILNTIAFLIRDENLFIKQHAETPWTKLNMIEFLNWPNVSVELKLPDIHLERKNMHKFYRYIACDSNELNQPDDLSDINLITHITKTADDGKPYTQLFVRYYFLQFINFIKKHLLCKVNSIRLQQIEIICHQFLQDIREMNIAEGSICTNTTVGFHIGNSKYRRQKQMVTSDKNNGQGSESKNIINLLEIVLPQVDCTLHYLKAEQDLNDSTSVTFKSLNSLLQNVSDPNSQELANFVDCINNKCLSYSCVFCNEKFTNSSAATDLIMHFAQQHKLGHPLLCRLCGKQFEIKVLAGQRWKHNCI